MTFSLLHGLRASRGYWLVLVVVSCMTALSYAQSPAQSSNDAPGAARSGAKHGATVEQIEAGKALFAAQCSFCHGRDATGGEGGPDLTASALVEQDVDGEKIGAVVRNGRPDKGMPAFHHTDEQLAAIVAFIHDRKANAKEGRRLRGLPASSKD